MVLEDQGVPIVASKAINMCESTDRSHSMLLVSQARAVCQLEIITSLSAFFLQLFLIDVKFVLS